MTRPFSKQWSQMFRRARAAKARADRRARPAVEPLDDRIVPATLVVTSDADNTIAGDDQVTLREAIIAANTDTTTDRGHTGGGADTIIFGNGFDFSGGETLGAADFTDEIVDIIFLTGGQLTISSNVTVTGSGASLLVIDGNESSRVFEITSAGTAEISSLTIQNGNSESEDESDNGGGIWNAGQLTLRDCVVSDNRGDYGGGVYADDGATLNIHDSTISGNTGRYGGGVYGSNSTVNIHNSTISGNTAEGDGGGVYGGDYSTVNIRNSTISGNIASDGYGGGIYGGDYSELTVIDSTISGNTAEYGGGIYIDYDVELTVIDSTISGNIALESGGGVYVGGLSVLTVLGSTISGNTAGTYGGGISSANGDAIITVTNSTISGNQASEYGGGIYNAGTLILTNTTVAFNTSDADDSGSEMGGGLYNGGQATITNSIVALNFRGIADGPVDDIFGDVTANFSLISDTTGATISGASNLLDNFPDLSPLADHGGPTFTHALLTGSQGIDAGNNTLAVDADGNPLTTDQRGTGFDRLSGTVDMGAFEVQVPPAPPEIDVRGNGVSIADGDTTPDAADHTDFGSTAVAGGTVARTFTIHNTGTGTLNLSGVLIMGYDADDFTVTAQPDSQVAPGGSTTFEVTFNPTAAGVRMAAVVFTSDDPDEVSYDFAIQGVGTTSVAAVSAGWGSRTAPLQDASGGRLLPAGRTTSLPWAGVHRIVVTLSDAATLTASDVTVTGINVADYGPVTVTGSGTTWTVTFARSIGGPDRVTVTIGNATIGTFTRRLDVLPGDANDDGVVNTQDSVLVRNMIVGISAMSLFGDTNGDGTVDMTDYNLVRSYIGRRLP